MTSINTLKEAFDLKYNKKVGKFTRHSLRGEKLIRWRSLRNALKFL